MNNNVKKGRLFVMSAPSGSGKTTLSGKMLAKYTNLKFSVSYTTRKPRVNEVNGVDYFFITKDEFKGMIDKHEFIEWAIVHENYYGTSLKTVDNELHSGVDLILDIDPQGAMQLKKKLPHAVYIFLTAPSLKILRERLINRGTDDIKTIDVRMQNARHELEYFSNYDYLIVNNDSESAFHDLEAIYRAEKLRVLAIKSLSDIINLD